MALGEAIRYCERRIPLERTEGKLRHPGCRASPDKDEGGPEGRGISRFYPPLLRL